LRTTADAIGSSFFTRPAIASAVGQKNGSPGPTPAAARISRSSANRPPDTVTSEILLRLERKNRTTNSTMNSRYMTPSSRLAPLRFGFGAGSLSTGMRSDISILLTRGFARLVRPPPQ